MLGSMQWHEGKKEAENEGWEEAFIAIENRDQSSLPGFLVQANIYQIANKSVDVSYRHRPDSMTWVSIRLEFAWSTLPPPSSTWPRYRRPPIRPLVLSISPRSRRVAPASGSFLSIILGS